MDDERQAPPADPGAREEEPAERRSEGSDAPGDLPVDPGDADKVSGGVVGPCDRQRQ